MADLKPLQRELLSLFQAQEASSFVEYLGRVSEAMTKKKRRSGRPRAAASATKRKKKTNG